MNSGMSATSSKFLLTFSFAIPLGSYTQGPIKKKLQLKKSNFLTNYRVCNGLLLTLAIGTVILIGLILTSVIGTNCDDNFVEISIIGLATEFVSYLPTAYFGRMIIKSLNEKIKKEQRESRKSFTEGESFEPISDRYIK